VRIGNYELVFEGIKRFYELKLFEERRIENLKGVTPHELIINGYSIKENTWGNVMVGLAKRLLETRKLNDSLIKDLTLAWSKQAVFSTVKKTNYKQVDNKYYINCNYEAHHMVWVICDVLEHCGIDLTKCKLYIHRPPAREPGEVKYVLEGNFIAGFSKYLHEEGLNDNNVEEIIKTIRKFNYVLKAKNTSYDNLFLMDDTAMCYNAIYEILKSYDISKNISEEEKAKSHIYAKLLTRYYYKLKKES